MNQLSTEGFMFYTFWGCVLWGIGGRGVAVGGRCGPSWRRAGCIVTRNGGTTSETVYEMRRD